MYDEPLTECVNSLKKLKRLDIGDTAGLLSWSVKNEIIGQDITEPGDWSPPK